MNSVIKCKVNNANAKFSTGPKTADGKVISSQNAIRHGIFSNQTVIIKGVADEKRSDFDHLLSQLVTDLKPKGAMQHLLVEKIAVNFWRMRRLLRYETGEVLTLLEDFVNKYLNHDEIEEFNKMSSRKKHLPVLQFYHITDTFSSEQEQELKIWIESLSSGEFASKADEQIIEYIVRNRFGKSADRLTARDRQDALAYFKQLSPQQKGKIRGELLRMAKARLDEMQNIMKWQRQVEIDRLVQSIPLAHHLDKVIKYETSLERSISRNLSMLKSLQGYCQ